MGCWNVSISKRDLGVYAMKKILISLLIAVVLLANSSAVEAKGKGKGGGGQGSKVTEPKKKPADDGGLFEDLVPYPPGVEPEG